MAIKTSNSSKRLKEFMHKMEVKQSDIVATTGITKSALSNYLHGTREPRQDQISRIADPYNLNPAWLMGYDVPMFNPDVITELNVKPTAEQAIILFLLSQLNDDGFNEAMKRIEELTQLDKYKKDES